MYRVEFDDVPLKTGICTLERLAQSDGRTTLLNVSVYRASTELELRSISALLSPTAAYHPS